MAILKHRSRRDKNANDMVDYLTCQSKKTSTVLLRDGNGDPLPRRDFLLEGIRCAPGSFAVECRALNRKWGKNLDPGDVKFHHYILSFDPRDAEDNGLTTEKAQQLAVEFAREHFPGHQIIVCTHPDGRNESGNIHAHIVLNSLRKFDAPADGPLCTGERSGWKAGYKHHLKHQQFLRLQADVMEMCKRNGLYQVDLLHESPRKQGECEYFAELNEQKKAGREAAERGEEPEKILTRNERMRTAVDDAAEAAESLDEFAKILAEKYRICVTVTGGQILYRFPDREKTVRGRVLGTACELGVLTDVFVRNRKMARDDLRWDGRAGTDRYHAPRPYDRKHNYVQDPITALYFQSRLPLVKDLQNNMRAVLESDALLRELPKDAQGRYDKEALRRLRERTGGRVKRAQAQADSLAEELHFIEERLQREQRAGGEDQSAALRWKRERRDTERRLTEAGNELRYCRCLQRRLDDRTAFGNMASPDAPEAVKISDLRAAARTIVWVQEHGYEDRAELQEAADHISACRQKAGEMQKAAESGLLKIEEEIARAEQDGSGQSSFHGKEPSGAAEDLRLRRADLAAERDQWGRELAFYRDRQRDLSEAGAHISRILGGDRAGEVRTRSRETGLTGRRYSPEEVQIAMREAVKEKNRS